MSTNIASKVSQRANQSSDQRARGALADGDAMNRTTTSSWVRIRVLPLDTPGYCTDYASRQRPGARLGPGTGAPNQGHREARPACRKAQCWRRGPTTRQRATFRRTWRQGWRVQGCGPRCVVTHMAADRYVNMFEDISLARAATSALSFACAS